MAYCFFQASESFRTEKTGTTEQPTINNNNKPNRIFIISPHANPACRATVPTRHRFVFKAERDRTFFLFFVFFELRTSQSETFFETKSRMLCRRQQLTCYQSRPYLSLYMRSLIFRQFAPDGKQK